MHEGILSLVNARRGHFAYESGHHGDLWLDLEMLCSEPKKLQPYVAELIGLIKPYAPDVVCGALVEGAFLALLVAVELGAGFAYAARWASEEDHKLWAVTYRVPPALHSAVAGKRVVIVNDVISAGSAVRGTYADLRRLRADVVAAAALAVLGDTFVQYAKCER